MEKENRVVFLKGRKVNLRPICKETDMEIALRGANDPELRKFVINSFPISREAEADWYDRNSKQRPDEFVLAIETKEGQYLGNIGANHIDWINRVATTGTFIFQKDCLGKGYGTEAKMLLLNYLFKTLNLRKICSKAKSFNKRSVNYSLKCGYKIEGVKKKQFFHNGKYHDEIMLAVFSHDWPAIWKKWNKRK